MSEKIAVDLGNVQKTLFLPLWGRAHETGKPDPLLVDKTALEIIERVDFDFSTIAGKMSELSQIGWIMRSLRVDGVIAGFLEKHPQATVVNIGCGLDTTFNRVDNGQLLWYDLDLPDVIALRKKLIREDDRSKIIATSFLGKGWLKDLAVRDGVLFIAAGVFYYFEAEEIKSFFKALADEFPDGEIVFDVCSPLGVKTANRMVVKSAGMDERSFLKWGVADTRDILSWDERFELLQTLYYFGDKRLRPRVKLLGAISDWLKIQYMVHLRL